MPFRWYAGYQPGRIAKSVEKCCKLCQKRFAGVYFFQVVDDLAPWNALALS